MNGCVHDWQRVGTRLQVVYSIDDWQGVTEAVVCCSACQAHALIRMLHWRGRNLATRVFSLAPLPAQVVSVYLRNMKSAYCDLTRHAAESTALFAAAGDLTGGVIVEVPDMLIIGVLGPEELGGRRPRSWRDQPPDEKDPFWASVLAQHGVAGSRHAGR